MAPNPNDPLFYRVPPATQEQKKSWLQSHMVLGVIFLVAVLAAIVAGIYYWQTTRDIPAFVQAPQHKNPTENWMAYKNDIHGFEIKIPQGWTVTEAGGYVNFLSPETKAFLEENGKNCANPKLGKECVTETFSFDVRFSNKSTLEEDVKNYNVKVETQNYNSVDFKVYPVLGLIPGTIYEAQKDGKYFVFDYYHSDQKNIKQILSTFKFNSSLSNWKTYKNDKYGFEFKYPSKYTTKNVTSDHVNIFVNEKDYISVSEFEGSLQDWQKEHNYPDAKFLTVSGVQAVQYEDATEKAKLLTTLIQGTARLYSIEYIQFSSQEIDVKSYDQIVASFMFTSNSPYKVGDLVRTMKVTSAEPLFKGYPENYIVKFSGKTTVSGNFTNYDVKGDADGPGCKLIFEPDSESKNKIPSVDPEDNIFCLLANTTQPPFNKSAGKATIIIDDFVLVYAKGCACNAPGSESKVVSVVKVE